MGLLRPTPSSNQDSQQFHFLLGNTQIGRSVQSQQIDSILIECLVRFGLNCYVEVSNLGCKD